MKTTLTRLNNKTRKGLYLYIKETGKPARYYKIKDVTTASKAIKHYKKKYTQKTKKEDKTQKKTQKQKKDLTPKKYLHKIRKLGKIKTHYKEGIRYVKTQNIHVQTRTGLQKIREDLIRQAVSNKKLIKILAQDENMRKISASLEYRTNYLNQKGEIIAQTTKFNMTPTQYYNQQQQLIKPGENVESGSKGFQQKMSDAGYQTTVIKPGNISATTTTIILRTQ